MGKQPKGGKGSGNSGGKNKSKTNRRPQRRGDSSNDSSPDSKWQRSKPRRQNRDDNRVKPYRTNSICATSDRGATASEVPFIFENNAGEGYPGQALLFMLAHSEQRAKVIAFLKKEAPTVMIQGWAPTKTTNTSSQNFGTDFIAGITKIANMQAASSAVAQNLQTGGPTPAPAGTIPITTPPSTIADSINDLGVAGGKKVPAKGATTVADPTLAMFNTLASQLKSLQEKISGPSQTLSSGRGSGANPLELLKSPINSKELIASMATQMLSRHLSITDAQSMAAGLGIDFGRVYQSYSQRLNNRSTGGGTGHGNGTDHSGFAGTSTNNSNGGATANGRLVQAQAQQFLQQQQQLQHQQHLQLQQRQLQQQLQQPLSRRHPPGTHDFGGTNTPGGTPNSGTFGGTPAIISGTPQGTPGGTPSGTPGQSRSSSPICDPFWVSDDFDHGAVQRCVEKRWMRRDGITVSRNKVRLYIRDNHIDMAARHIVIPTIPRVKGSVSMNAVFCADQPEPLMVLAAKACIIHQLLLDPRKLDPFITKGSKGDADGVRSITQFYNKSAPPSDVSNGQPLKKGIVRKLSASDFGDSPNPPVTGGSASEVSKKRRKTSSRSLSPQNVTGLLTHHGTPATESASSNGPVAIHVPGLPSHQGTAPGLPSHHGTQATEPASFIGTPATATASSKLSTISAGATIATAVGSKLGGNVFVGRKRVKFSPGGPTNPQEVEGILNDKDGIDLPADDTLGERQLLHQRQQLQRNANPSLGLSGIFLQQPEYGNSTHNNSLAPTPNPTPAPTPSPAPTCLQQDGPLSQRTRKQRDHAMPAETASSGNSAMETSNRSFSSFLRSNKLGDMFDSTDGNAGVNPPSGSWTASSFLRPPDQSATMVSHSPGTVPDGSDRPPDTQPFESGVI